MKPITIENGSFCVNGETICIRSGAIHYFRSQPEDWYDRLYKLKKCGLNTVETYVPWNLHEPKEGTFCFEGICDISRFIQTAEKLGLYVIVRPGPYICAEWDFGGLPSWLLSYKDMKLRCNHELYLQKVDAYFDRLIPQFQPHLTTNGRNVIMVQVENEYGSFGCDKQYLAYIRDGLIKRGVDVLLFTSDGPCHSMLTGGAVPGLLPTINFGSDAQGNFEFFEPIYPQYPKMVMEYWAGWFDHWGQPHITREPSSVQKDLAYMVENNISFNLYLFHGGTNFGFMNGANYVDIDGYRPTVTSYDYDAFLTEWGEPTEKYWNLKKLLNPEEEVSFPDNRCGYGTFSFQEAVPLMDILDRISCPVTFPVPLTFEELGISYGYVLYRNILKGRREKHPLALRGLRDRAQVFINGKEAGVYQREVASDHPVEIGIEGDEEIQLDILVENQGRINYGPHMHEQKGIVDGVWLGTSYGSFLHTFENYPLPMDDISIIPFSSGSKINKEFQYTGPVFLRALFTIVKKGDTFLRLQGLRKGVAFLNGYNLGRYWEIGPQVTLYIPASLFLNGENELIIFEQHGVQNPEFVLQKNHVLDKAKDI